MLEFLSGLGAVCAVIAYGLCVYLAVTNLRYAIRNRVDKSTPYTGTAWVGVIAILGATTLIGGITSVICHLTN